MTRSLDAHSSGTGTRLQTTHPCQGPLDPGARAEDSGLGRDAGAPRPPALAPRAHWLSIDILCEVGRRGEQDVQARHQNRLKRECSLNLHQRISSEQQATGVHRPWRVCDTSSWLSTPTTSPCSPVLSPGEGV